MKAALINFIVLLVICIFQSCTLNDSDKTEGPTEMEEIQSPDFSELVEGNYNVALLLIEGTYNSELTAPMDIFHHTKFREGVRAMNVFTVSNTYELVRTFEGLEIRPDYNFMDTVPLIDILVIPAGEHNLDSDLKDKDLIDFVKEVGEEAEFVCSHCDGAFLLAKSGLLDGHRSTTFPDDIPFYKESFTHLQVEDGPILVHDGKFITSVGGAKSFEASLYLAELLYGKKIADELAEGMVIDWNKELIEYLKVK